MQNIGWKLTLIIVILGLLGLALVTKDIRLGKDLRGGVSLIYAVDVAEDADAQQVLLQTINSLKKRVNPSGKLDISMEPLGNNRIEIVMPLPNEQVKGLRQQYEDALRDLLSKAQIEASDLDQAIGRGDAEQRFCKDQDSTICQLIRDLQEAYRVKGEKRIALATAQADPQTEPATINQLQQEIADAEVEYDNLRRQILRQSISESRVRRVLQLSTAPIAKKNPNGSPMFDASGDLVMDVSPRENQLTELKTDFDHLADEIDNVVEKYDAFQAERIGYDDPEDLKRLLQGTGVLEFRIAVDPNDAASSGVNIVDLRDQLVEVGPENTDSPIARWFPINDLRQWYDSDLQLADLESNPESYFAGRGFVGARHDNVYYMLLYDTPAKKMVHSASTEWRIDSAYPTVDQLGRPAVGFRLDSTGGGYMHRLTSQHVNQSMAIVLDGQVYSAPNLESPISSSGIIQGEFGQRDIDYLTLVLAAGALEARLSAEPIAENTLGPTLGQDNLNAGATAFMIALIVVAVFMIAYYFFAGVVAVLALAANGVIIFGFMFAIDGTFTLPGLAGIVLTIGMAVDANVLIYERIREELMDAGSDLRAAVREGYGKAFSTIFDANVTNLIVCYILSLTATTEVKGFALTLAIGICATLFTALFVTRQIYYLYTDWLKARSLNMLPIQFPAIHRALEPNIQWVSLRYVFWTFSIVAVTISLVLVSTRGVDMLDTELRGGVSATLNTKITGQDADGAATHLTLVHEDVRQRIQDIATDTTPIDQISDVSETVAAHVREEFANASVLTIGETQTIDGRLAASSFQIKVANPSALSEDQESEITKTVIALLVHEFSGQLDVTPSLRFDGRNEDNIAGRVYPIDQPNLGDVIGDRSVNIDDRRDLLGGAAIVLRGLDPAVDPDDVKRRITNMRLQPDFRDQVGRNVEVFGLTPVDSSDPSLGYTEVLVAVTDANLDYQTTDFDVWSDRLAAPEWRLVRSALTEETSLDQVSSYSSAVAQTLKANAFVAVILSLLGILAYIWVRFGSLRYSLAAIVALAHDVTISLGVLALTFYIGSTGIGQALGIEEFRIDLGVVAALMTIIGYSLNDTIVILDRIRENRGKLPVPTAPIVNRSINQTFSRTLLTSVTTLMAVGIMYAQGGGGIRPFTFCLLVGLVIGTYSSVAIAAPLVVKGQKAADDAAKAESGALTPATSVSSAA